MNKSLKSAADLHERVPPGWYYYSIQRNPFQRLWHKVRFREVAKLIEPTEGKVLDIGSADGMFTKTILDKSGAKEIIGIDVLKECVDWANKHWKKEKRLNFKLGNAHKLKFRARTFDAVFALEVMEHITEPDEAIKEMKRVLKKNGYLIILVPSDSLLFKVIWWFVTKFAWARIWDDCHIQSFDEKNKLSKHIKKVKGLKLEEDKKFWFGMLNVVKARRTD